MQNLDVKYYEFCLTYKMRFSIYDKSFPIRHYYLEYNFLIFQWLYGNMWCHSVRRPITWHVLGRLYSWNITKKCFILLVDLFQITTKQHCTKSAGNFDFFNQYLRSTPVFILVIKNRPIRAVYPKNKVFWLDNFRTRVLICYSKVVSPRGHISSLLLSGRGLQFYAYMKETRKCL